MNQALVRPGAFWLVPGQSADISHSVEDSEHSDADTWNPQHTGALETEGEAVTMETDRKYRSALVDTARLDRW